MRTISYLTVCLVLLISDFTGQAQTTFEQHQVSGRISMPDGLCSGDVNLDGKVDLILGSGSQGVSWLENTGSAFGEWTRHFIDQGFGECLHVALHDLDQDGDSDVVAASWSRNEVAWFEQVELPGTWQKHTLDANLTWAHEVQVVDVDLDGLTDILATGAGNHQVCWYRNKGGDPLTWERIIISGDFPGSRSVKGVDLDLDDDIDLVGAAFDSDEIVIWENLGTSPITWRKSILTNSFNGSHKVDVQDFNGDGFPDILGTAYYQKTIAWWENPGTIDGIWRNQVIENDLTGAVIAMGQDLDLDGDLDIAATGQDSHTVLWFENTGNPDSPWKKNVLSNNLTQAWPICFGDFDQDKDMDIVVGGHAASKVVMFQNIQNGRLNRTLQTSIGKQGAALFIPPEFEDPGPCLIALPHGGDPYSYTRLRDLLIEFSMATETALLIPESLEPEGPGYQLNPSGIINEYITYLLDYLPADPDSIYLAGFDCNGQPALRYPLNGYHPVLGVIALNPLIPELSANEYLDYPDLPVVICSGTLHTDRNNHEDLHTQIQESYGKCWLNDLDGVGNEVLIGNLTQEMIDARRYIDTVGQTSSVKRLTNPQAFQARILNDPLRGSLRIKIQSCTTRPVQIMLISMTGQRIHDSWIPTGTIGCEISTSHYPSGIYLVCLIHDHEVICERILFGQVLTPF